MGVTIVLGALRGLRLASLKASRFAVLPAAFTLSVCLRLVALFSNDTSGVPGVQSAALLLGAMLLYDGFFVFVQPLLTRSSSVMVEVRSCIYSTVLCRTIPPLQRRD